MSHVVIVGAGISGLAAAYRLQHLSPSVEITVLERQTRPGGTIWTERRDGFQVELGPNGFLDTKSSTRNLCDELGLGERLVAASEAAGRNRYLFLDGRLRRLPGSLKDFLRTDLLSWRGKLSLLAERLRPRRRQPADESIDAFVRRRAGAEATQLADAMVTGIHAGDPNLLSVQAAFPRLAGFERDHGSIFKGMSQAARQRHGEPTAMWSFREGLRLLVETLPARLAQPPRLGVAVRRIESMPGGWLVRGEGQDTWHANAVVLACPAHEQAAILSDLDAPLAEEIGAIAYNRVAVVALGYRRSDVPVNLDGFGFIAPQRTRRDVLGVQWCSSIYPERAPAGMVLLRAMCGGWNRADILDWNDAQLLQAVRAELRQAMAIEAAPVFHHIQRWERAIPQYHVGHLGRVAAIEEGAGRHAGLFLTGNAYRGVALNDCTEEAARVSERVWAYLSAVTPLV